jgi:transcriptional regulator with XRE-family HTH domain
MSRSNRGDEAFKRRVAEEFSRACDQARAQGWTVERFAQSLGVTRAAFHKYVTKKAIPSLRVLALARTRWGVQIPYGELGESYLNAKKGDLRQMELRFSVETISKDQVEIKRLSPRGDNAVELLIRIDFSKTA